MTLPTVRCTRDTGSVPKLGQQGRDVGSHSLLSLITQPDHQLLRDHFITHCFPLINPINSPTCANTLRGNNFDLVCAPSTRTRYTGALLGFRAQGQFCRFPAPPQSHIPRYDLSPVYRARWKLPGRPLAPVPVVAHPDCWLPTTALFLSAPHASGITFFHC